MLDERTRPAAEDLRFRSGATGEHILDIYLEACEMGGKPLPELLSLIFNELGELDADNFEFRVNSNTRRLQFRFGVFIAPEDGWRDVAGGTLLQSRGDWQANMPYEQTDLVSYNENIYLCLVKHSSATFNTSCWQRLIEFGHLDSLRQEVATNTAQVAADKASVTIMKNQVAADKTTATTAAGQAASSAANASTSEANSKSSEDKSKVSETNSKASETASKTAEINSKQSEINSKASETASKASETNSKASETASKLSETNSKQSEVNAKGSENASKASETASKTSESKAKLSELNSETFASTANNAANTASAMYEMSAQMANDAEVSAVRAEAAATVATGAMVDGGGVNLSSGTYPPPLQVSGNVVTTFWKVTVGGTVSGEVYGVGDTLVYSKSLASYYKIDSTESVTSVNNKTGAVTLVAADLPDLQPKDATLTAMASQPTAADRVIYFTGLDMASTMTVTAVARTLLDDYSIAAMQTTLGVSPTTDTVQRKSMGSTFTSVAGSWYRIATTAVNIGRNSGIFRLYWAVGNEIGHARFTCEMINGAAFSIEQISFAAQGTLGFDAMRLVYHPTATGNDAHIEVRALGAMASCVVNTEVIDPLGWLLTSPNTPGSVPAGYTTTLFNFVPDLVPNTYAKVTINREGRVVSGGSLLASDIPSLDWSKITSGIPTTLAGYGITDALPSTGNAVSASKLATARDISLYGDGTATFTFDGSANATAQLTLATTGVAAGTFTKVVVDAKGRVTSGDVLSASDIPALDWGKITTGRPTTLAGYGITDALAASANAVSAAKWATARTLTLTGSVTGSVSFDGSGNVSLAATVTDNGHAHTIANVTGLQGALDGKAAASHVHAYMADGGSYGTIFLSNWIRTTGATGWYNETYGGGWHMQDTTWIRAYNGKKVYVANGEADAINSGGGVYAAGNGNFNDVYIRSDIRLKSNIVTIANALAKLKHLTGNLYDKAGVREAGLIAQELAEVQPESVYLNADGTLSIAHAGALALIVEAIKELDEKVEALQ
ncbi:hypothetical protein GL270_21050 [Aeromonas veronii]|uniref:tail fiber domain-containing protein n=1 Tax=Aeromonas veronii TaxID=654 RepID=UPI001C5BC3AC|nr:tail fiber domain-containing protein [Aeromonas veronii]MBW3783690.1 hypothetical protein [Aeromonas veronii]